MPQARFADWERVERRIEETAFSGVVLVELEQRTLHARAAGWADRARGFPITLATRFAIASGTKALTALTVMSLVADRTLELDLELQGAWAGGSELLPAGVTLRQLLAHTSGIGDYLDEDEIPDIEDYALAVPAQRLAQPGDFLPLLRGRPAKHAPGEHFRYCNSGYVVLALLIEALTGRSYYEVVHERVCVPAGLRDTAFLRLDELPPSAAVGYLPARGWRSNEHLVPARGAGDGGIYTTVADLSRFWQALNAGQILPLSLVSEMWRQQHPSASPRGYGLGFWLAPERGAAFIEGSDAGISFRSWNEPRSGLRWSVISNTTRGAWPIAKELEGALA